MQVLNKCFHCGKPGERVRSRGIVLRGGRHISRPVCERCWTTRGRWLGWRPDHPLAVGEVI